MHVESTPQHSCFLIHLQACLCMYMQRNELVLLSYVIDARLEMLSYSRL